jgi:hypothetical protein
MQPAHAQRIASQPARSALHRKQSAHRAAQRSALPRILYITSHRANATARAQRIASQTIRANATSPRIANNPRTDNQPATHRPPRPLRIIRRTANTSHLQLCTSFAVLCAGFVWFVVLTFPKFNLYTLRIAILSCVRSSVGTELGNLAQCPGFESGRKFSDFFYFRRLQERANASFHFLHS